MSDGQQPFHCRHGRTLAGPCTACQLEVDEGAQAFEADVLAGVYNARGYTEREWIAAGYPRATWRTAA